LVARGAHERLHLAPKRLRRRIVLIAELAAQTRQRRRFLETVDLPEEPAASACIR
jgi:hypothetical protein